jgi:hypothetical protein
MQETICQAIRAKRRLTVHQKTPIKTLVRVVEPHALYPTLDDALMLESWFVSGDYQRTATPHWCPIPLNDISKVTLCNETFTPQATYKPMSKKYARALCRIH